MASSGETASSTLRPIRILFRSKEAVELYTLPDISSKSSGGGEKAGLVVLRKGATTFHVSSPTGNCAYVHSPSAGLVRCPFDGSADTGDGASFLAEDTRKVQLAKCSPLGTFLATWQRPTKESPENLKVWNAATGELVTAFGCKKATLKTLQWTFDEKLAFHMVTNELHIYASSWEKAGRVRCPNVSSFSLPGVRGQASNEVEVSSASSKYLLVTFIPENKGKPARLDLLRYPDRLGRDSSTAPSNDNVNVPSGPSLASKSLFRCEEISAQWSPRGDAALVLAQTAVDATGESYYGSTHLFLFLADDGKRVGNGAALQVPLPPEASKDANGSVPIVDCAWSPGPTKPGPVPFGVVSGKMPALASLHHGATGEPTFLFGRAHRNCMDWSPHGRFVVLGGYGNLAGGMDFWDRHKGKRIPQHVRVSDGNTDGAQYVTLSETADLDYSSPSPVVGHQWAPDGRTYLVSTISPRMNVDNGARLHHYDGSEVDVGTLLGWEEARYKPDKLLCAEYVPAPTTASAKEFHYYPDRPQSPPPRGDGVEVLTGGAAKAAMTRIRQRQQHVGGVGGKTSGGGASYVPPAARGGGGGGAYVPPGARKRTGGVVGGGGASGGRGGGSLSERMRQEREGSAANVSAKKIIPGQKKGLVGAASVVGAAPGGGGEAAKSKNALRREKQRLAKEQVEREAVEAEERKKAEEKAKQEANAADPEKRAKKIKKVLKQIEDIKKKVGASGAEMNEDQKKKVGTEEGLRNELAALGL